MFILSIYFAFLIMHLSLFSIPTCYISFAQEATQHCSYDENLFHADQYKHSHNVYDATPNLLTYSAISKFIEIIKEADSLCLLREGSNNIIKKINNIDATIRVFIKDGIILSFNGFKGLSDRVVSNKIYL